MKKSRLLQERIVYKPFEYQTAADYWLKQQQAHWLHTEVPMMSDVNDWKIVGKIHFEEQSSSDYIGTLELNKLTRETIIEFFDIKNAFINFFVFKKSFSLGV